MTRYHIAADIGGTFTDFIVREAESGIAFTGKIPSTPQNPSEAVIAWIKERFSSPQEIEFFVHGTTVGLNAFLENKGDRVLLITTADLSGYYTIARGDRKEIYKLKYRKPKSVVKRSDVHEVRERLLWDGSVLTPLIREDFKSIIEKITREVIPSVAVCFIHAFAYPEHELEARKILEESLENTTVTLSHEITREWREYERASTTIVSAYIAPVIKKYLTGLRKATHDIGVTGDLHVMQSSGGIMTVKTAIEQPSQTLFSGPIGGVIGGVALAEVVNRPNLICVDMGGTSFDMTLIRNGKATTVSQTSIDGIPLLIPMQEMHTIGAGGGSIGWIEAGGLRVGPQSAGANPGPACYGKGGTEPTVTDANLILNRIGTKSVLGGRMELYKELAQRAICNLASELQMEELELAEGVISIINSKMADGIRTITVGRGIDPREFSLVAFGGAGPMHAVWLARELEIAEVIIPNSPGAFSALGMLQADLRHDLIRPFYFSLDTITIDDIMDIYNPMVDEGIVLLEKDGIRREKMQFELTSDMRYLGQEYTVSVLIRPNMSVEMVEAEFHNTYFDRYGHSTPSAPVEFVNLRLGVFGQIVRAPMVFGSDNSDASACIGKRQVIFDGKAIETEIYQRAKIKNKSIFNGPFIIEEDTATTIVPPGYQGIIDDFGNIVISLE